MCFGLPSALWVSPESWFDPDREMPDVALAIVQRPDNDVLNVASSSGFLALHVAAFLDYADVCAAILAKGGDELALGGSLDCQERMRPLDPLDFPVGTTPLEVARPLCALLACLGSSCGVFREHQGIES